jgi:tRNA A37 threonylcarbamoyladenosine biosynthesis protein TsaE
MKVGDLVKYRHGDHNAWLGLIVREIPGTDEIKVIEWTHRNGGRDHGSYRARDLELVNEDR